VLIGVSPNWTNFWPELVYEHYMGGRRACNTDCGAGDWWWNGEAGFRIDSTAGWPDR